MNELVRIPTLRPMPGTTQAGDGMPRRRWTVDEIERMLGSGIIQSGERFELIGGNLVALPAKGIQHEGLKIALNAYWMKILPPEIMVAPETPFRLDDHHEPEPEFIVYPAAIPPRDVRGPNVLLVVEIADASLGHDRRIKGSLYASYGVREYWVMNAVTLETTVYRQPQGDAYTFCEEVPGSSLLTSTLAPALAVRLDALMGR